MFSLQGFHFFWVSIDHFRFHADQLVSITFLNHLQIVPIFFWLWQSSRSSLSTVLRNCSPGGEHCLSIGSFSIRGQRRWTFSGRMFFYLFHQLWRNCFFCLPYGTSHSQTGIYVNGASAPKCAFCFLLWLPPFSPLCPTYVQRASVCTRLS